VDVLVFFWTRGNDHEVTRTKARTRLPERAGMEVSRPKFEMKKPADALNPRESVIHSLRPAAEVDKVRAGDGSSLQGLQAGLARVRTTV